MGFDWWWMSIVMLTFWGLLIAVILSAFRARDAAPPTRSDDPISVLDRRLARGEIDLEEHRARVEAIRRSAR